jgi:hypothetical protein
MNQHQVFWVLVTNIGHIVTSIRNKIAFSHVSMLESSQIQLLQTDNIEKSDRFPAIRIVKHSIDLHAIIKFQTPQA